MSLGKDSIQKRVAKPATATTTKKAPAKKTAPKTSILANVAPATVEKVVAHKEGDAVVKYSLGERLPYYLL